jgi:hypothetical protein
VNRTYPSSACCSGEILISTDITKVEKYAFKGCTQLTSVAIPPNVIEVGSSAFQQSGLVSLTLSSCLSVIERYAFFIIDGLTSITVPSSVTFIDNFAFSNCDALTSITLLTNDVSFGIGPFGTDTSTPCNTGTNATLYVPLSLAPSVLSDVQYSCGVVTSGTYG